jgi:Na+/H+-translocating membrane pyrophosphatase
MLLSGTVTLFLVCLIGGVVAMVGFSWLRALASWVIALPGRMLRSVMGYVGAWQIHRANVRVLKASAEAAEERLRNEQIRDLFKK